MATHTTRHPSVSALTAMRLRKVVAGIRQRPSASFDMSTFGYRVLKDDQHPCGIVACLAGWGAVATGFRLSLNRGYLLGGDLERVSKYGEASVIAAKYFQLSRRQCELLYFLSEWPRRFRGAHRATPLHLHRRVEHFIRTGR